MRQVVTGGTVIHPGPERMERADVLIEDGVIRGLLTPEESRSLVRSESVPTVDAAGLLVAPGLIDMHVHLREPGEEYKETIGTGSMAAAAGGFVSVACMPNTKPVNDTRAVTQYILGRAQEEGFCRVLPVAAVSVGSLGERLTEFRDLADAGAVAFSDDGKPVSSAIVMRRALEYAKGMDKPVISHAEDLSLSRGGSMHEGELSTRMGLQGIPAEAEEIMVYRDLALARLTGGKLHIAHVSTAGSVDLIRKAKEAGLRVTAETAPHYVTLTHEAVLGFNTSAKMNPPLRTQRDLEALREGLREGVIDAVASDHAPHSSIEKEVEFEQAANGIVGLETCLGLTLKLVEEGVLTLFQAVRALSLNPARILGIPGGEIAPGAPADLTLIDLDARYQVKAENFYSLGRYTPFEGMTLTGCSVMTFLEGNPIRLDRREP